MSTAYIALGSNLDNPARQLQQAVSAIGAWPDATVQSVSRAYRSAAVGPGEQPDYLNAALCLTTPRTPAALLEQLQAQENHQGRVRDLRWGARTLDLDLLLYDDLQLATDSLHIPHPAMKERNFVLYPLAEIAGPQMVLPCGTDLDTLLSLCPRGDLVQTEVTFTMQSKPT